GVSARLSPRLNGCARQSARFFAKLAVTRAFSEALNYADLAADCERLFARGTNEHRELHRPQDARLPGSETPRSQTHRCRSQRPEVTTVGTLRCAPITDLRDMHQAHEVWFRTCYTHVE